MPQWGRPPGARLGRGPRAWAAQSWSEYDDRFEELETDDDAYHGVDLDQGYRPKRFVSDELRFTGLDLGQARRRHSYDDYSNSDEDDGRQGSRGLVRRGDTQVVLREKEDVLVERALERIKRARALGKTDVKLEPSEIEALRRAGVIPRPPDSPPTLPKAVPKGKKAAPAKSKAAETKKNGKKSSSNSPKPKAIEGRSRGRSTASNQSKSDSKEDAVVPYPMHLDDRYGYPPAYYSRGSAPGSRQQSTARTNSSQSMRQQHHQSMPPYQHPYYQSRYYSNPDVYGPRPGSGSSRAARPDPTDPEWEPRARSASNLVPYPLDHLPQTGGKATRFDPSDPRFASPPTTRRIVSGPPVAQYRRPQDELFLPQSEEPEVMQYLTNSSREDDDDDTNEDTTTSKDDDGDEDSDESGQGVQVNVEERPAGGYAIQTRATTRKGTGGSSGKAGPAARRRK